MNRKVLVGIVGALGLTLTACDQTTMGNVTTGQALGGIGGAVAGGVIGSQIGSGSGRLIATGVGAVLGGLLGQELGRTLNPGQQQQHTQAAYQAFETAPTGQTVQWGTPTTGTYGSVTPTSNYYSGTGGQQCRNYTQTIHVDGVAQTATGVACRNADGTWRIVS